MDLSIVQWTLLIGITVLGAVAQSAVGFGFGLISLPVFLLVLDVDIAIQLVIVLSLATAVILIFFTWRDTPVITFKRLLLGSVIGFPLGLYLFMIATPNAVKMVVAVSIFIALALTRFNLAGAGALKESRANGVGTGIVSGMMVTSLGMAGPAIAIYTNALGFGKSSTRGVIISVFLFSYGAAFVIHILFHGFAPLTTGLSLYLLPVTMFSVFAGQWLSKRISEELFTRLLTWMLIAVACYLVYSVSR